MLKNSQRYVLRVFSLDFVNKYFKNILLLLYLYFLDVLHMFGVWTAQSNHRIAFDNTMEFDRVLVPLMQNRGEQYELGLGMKAGNRNCTVRSHFNSKNSYTVLQLLNPNRFACSAWQSALTDYIYIDISAFLVIIPMWHVIAFQFSRKKTLHASIKSSKHSTCYIHYVLYW